MVTMIEGYPRGDNGYFSEWNQRPAELRRYISAARLFESRNKSMNGLNSAGSHLPSGALGIETIKEMFV